jgi:MFS superfamily sulfate permease-like transporter
MPALLLAVALIALTILVLLIAGVLAAIITGIALLNVFVLLLGAQSRRARKTPAARAARWRPSAFRRVPEAADADVAGVEGEAVPAGPAESSLEHDPDPQSITIRRR